MDIRVVDVAADADVLQHIVAKHIIYIHMYQRRTHRLGEIMNRPVEADIR